MRVIHISDTHISPSFRRENSLKLEALLRRVLDEGFDHLAITGDLTDNADLESLRVFRGILRSHGLLRSDRTTVIPGNHDIFGTVRRVADLLRFPGSCAAVDYDGRIRRFRDELGELFEGAESSRPDSPFPFVKTVGGLSFIGLNSNAAYSRLRNLFASGGGVRTGDLEILRPFLERPDAVSLPKVLLAHHGSWMTKRRRRGGGDPLKEQRADVIGTLRNLGVGAVLYGHTHEMCGGRRDGLVFANAGGAVDNGEPGALHFNAVNYDARLGLFRLSFRRVELAPRRTGRLSGRVAGDNLRTVYQGG